jgi:hypothetical protein
VGNIAYGSPLSQDGKHLESDPGEQSVLSEIHQLRESGHKLRGIASALNHRELRTRRGSPWRLEHVARIVKRGYAAPRPTFVTAPEAQFRSNAWMLDS